MNAELAELRERIARLDQARNLFDSPISKVISMVEDQGLADAAAEELAQITGQLSDFLHQERVRRAAEAAMAPASRTVVVLQHELMEACKRADRATADMESAKAHAQSAEVIASQWRRQFDGVAAQAAQAVADWQRERARAEVMEKRISELTLYAAQRDTIIAEREAQLTEANERCEQLRDELENI